MEKEVDVTKSQQFIDLMKANEALVAQMASMQKTFGAAEEIVKAQVAAKRAVAIESLWFSFVAADQREVVADVIENPAQAVLVSVLEKAAADLKAKTKLWLLKMQRSSRLKILR